LRLSSKINTPPQIRIKIQGFRNIYSLIYEDRMGHTTLMMEMDICLQIVCY